MGVRQKNIAIGAGLLCLVAVAWTMSLKIVKTRQEDSIKNFVLAGFTPPTGWKKTPHGTLSLFRYENLKTRMYIYGSTQQVEDETNPTPELDTEGLAKNLEEASVDFDPSVQTKRLGDIKGKDSVFKVVRRISPSKAFVTAFLARGNTTVILTMTGPKAKLEDIEREYGDFQNLVANLETKETIHYIEQQVQQ